MKRNQIHADQIMEKLALQTEQTDSYDKVLLRLKIGSIENVFANFIIITFLYYGFNTFCDVNNLLITLILILLVYICIFVACVACGFVYT